MNIQPGMVHDELGLEHKRKYPGEQSHYGFLISPLNAIYAVTLCYKHSHKPRSSNFIRGLRPKVVKNIGLDLASNQSRPLLGGNQVSVPS